MLIFSTLLLVAAAFWFAKGISTKRIAPEVLYQSKDYLIPWIGLTFLLFALLWMIGFFALMTMAHVRPAPEWLILPVLLMTVAGVSFLAFWAWQKLVLVLSRRK